MSRGIRFLVFFIGAVCALPSWAGFGGTELFLPAAGRVSGAGGSEFYTTLWVTNPSATERVTTTLQFLRSGGPNFAPPSVTYTLDPGESRVFENVTETVFALPGVLGALRVLSSAEVLVAARIYNQSSGAPLRNTQGLFFSGVPAGLALRPGDSALIQGVNQSEDFRYNFFAVETTGQPATLRMKLRDARGTLVAQKDYGLGAFQQMLAGVTDIQPGFTTSNATLEASVISGPGQVIVAGSQTANQSQDGSGFEMAFRPITSASPFMLNGLSGNVTLAAGPNVSITPTGNTLTISAASAISAVTATGGLTGGGTSGNVTLGIASGGVTSDKIAAGHVVKSINGLTDAITLTAGSNITINPSGSTLTISSTAGGGAVTRDNTLRGNGTSASPLGLKIPIEIDASCCTQGIIITGGSNPTGILAVQPSGGTAISGSTGDFNALGFIGDGPTNAALYGFAAPGTTAYAGVFDGKVVVNGSLAKSAGSFRIDHPLDPENKFLYHSFVESPDMMNVYNGNVLLDGRGEATVELPEWFSELNRDYRYQLTALGSPSPNLHVAEKIAGNRFRIAGGTPGAEVSWQVTGIRQDPYAEAHRIPVEEMKPAVQRGLYTHPELYGLPPERGLTPVRPIDPKHP